MEVQKIFLLLVSYLKFQSIKSFITLFVIRFRRYKYINESEKYKEKKGEKIMKKQKGQKRYIVIMLAIILSIIPSLSAYSANNSSEDIKDIVARVNDQVITKDDLYEALVKKNGKEVLDSLITKKIVELEAEKQKINVSEEEIQNEVDKMIEQYGGKEVFRQTLESYGYSEDDIKSDIKINLSIKKLLESEITITEEEMKNYFEKNNEQVKVRHILVDSKEKAEEVKEKLASGNDFAELAKEYSIDKGTKNQGGELEFFARGIMVKEFEDVAFSTEVGKISDPIKTIYGYHIIKVEEKKVAKEANYEESKDKIKDILFKEKLPSAYNTWIQDKYAKYDIENLL